MPSNAYTNLDRRMKDIEQLIQAHTALTQFKKASKKAAQLGGGLAKISEVVDSLVSSPGPGRPTEVDALNRAAMVLLSAHLQGYVEDLFTDTAKILIGSSVKDVDELINQASSRFSNPHAWRIDQLFASTGLSKITNSLKWQKASNKAVKNRLTQYIETRNDIAHGKQASVQKFKVVQFKKFVALFAKNLDEIVGREVESVTRTRPW